MPLPPYYLKVILTSRRACVIAMMMYRRGILQVLFESFTKGPGGSPMYSSWQVGSLHWNQCMTPLLLTMGSLTLGGHQQVLDGATTFEVCMYTIPPTDLLNAFAETLCIRYNYMILGFDFIGSGLDACSTLVGSPITLLTWGMLSLNSTLSKAHLGYLHWVSAFLQWSISLQRSSGLLHTVLALSLNLGLFTWYSTFWEHIVLQKCFTIYTYNSILYINVKR